MPLTPSAPITTNHVSITGPNTRPIRCVPKVCVPNNATRMARALMPSSALSTEIAGVMMPSP